MTFREIVDCFDLIPVERADDPCHYAFCLPNSAAYTRWAGFPAAARPENGRVAAGKGFDVAQCRASALGEAVELACACAWGDESLIRAAAVDLDAPVVSAAALNGFSDAQLAERDAWNAGPFGVWDWRPAPEVAGHEMDWVRAETAQGAGVFVPADCVYVGRCEAGDAHALSIATTSGCAAGPTAEAAQLSGLLELLERDAVGRWWYGQRSAVEHRPDLPDAVAQYLNTRKRRTFCQRLSSVGHVPVVAAISCAPDGGTLAMGFGCDLTPKGAARSAVTELFQTEIALVQRHRQSDPLARRWCDGISLADLPAIRPSDAPAKAPASLSDVVHLLAQAGLNCAFVDLTRPGFGVQVWRALLPGAWSDKPRFTGLERARLQPPAHGMPLLV